MAKKPKLVAPENQPDAQTIKRLFGAIEHAQDNIKSAMMSAAAGCKSEHSAIKDAKSALRTAGLTARVIDATIKERRAQRTLEKARAALEGEDIKLGEITRAAIGGFFDLPLGRAAVERETKQDEERDLRPRALKDRETQRVAENVIALTGKDGIKPLDAQA